MDESANLSGRVYLPKYVMKANDVHRTMLAYE